MATGKSLVIVESPAKAKTLEKFLGRDFRVLASYGHVRDLPKKGLGVDRSNSYEPTYEVLAGKAKMLAEIIKAARTAPTIYLAADPDREGEAISWHLQETLKGAAKNAVFKRVRFNEITKKAVLAAMEAEPHLSPEDIAELDQALAAGMRPAPTIDPFAEGAPGAV